MFVCTGNSARSQMAEGLARQMAGPLWEVYSAGIEPKGVNPHAVLAMRESEIDISAQTSKVIDPDLLAGMDLIVTLCGDARDRCPVIPPSVTHLHWPLPDPATAEGSEDEVTQAFREVRDEIAKRIKSLLA
ncbi:MAG: arsenate reductase (thioredoxin) [Bacillota bacterium]